MEIFSDVTFCKNRIVGGYAMTDMKQVMNSMENSMKLQIQAKSERRARKAEEEEKDFLEKLRQAAASQAEIEGKAMKVKGSQAATQRDQLMGLMMNTL